MQTTIATAAFNRFRGPNLIRIKHVNKEMNELIVEMRCVFSSSSSLFYSHRFLKMTNQIIVVNIINNILFI